MVRDNPETFADLDGHFYCGTACAGFGVAINYGASTPGADSTPSNPPTTTTPVNQTAPAQNQEKPQVAAIGTLDALHPAMTPQAPGKIQQQDVYYKAALVTGNEKDGYQIVERIPDASIMMKEVQTGGNDKPTICAKACSVSSDPDQQHVSSVGSTATIQQTFTVNKKPALAIIIKPDGVVVAVGKKIQVTVRDSGSTFKGLP
jgi:hypothetical protein